MLLGAGVILPQDDRAPSGVAPLLTVDYPARAMTPASAIDPALASALELVVRYLSRQEGVRRIWVFGSVAKMRPADWRSDLDIAVEGLDRFLHGRAWSELDAQIPQPLDLIRFEDASEALRGEIEKWGRLLYAA